MPILQDCALLALFCSVDDFCQVHLPTLNARAVPAKGKRNRPRSLSQSEIITLLIAFQQSQFRCFKAFYTGFVCTYWRQAFPRLVSYNRFVEFVPSVLTLLADYLKSLMGRCRGISFVDSTALAACHNRRITSHKVFAATAGRGKTSVGWFFGFKIHLAVNERGELIALAFTAGNIHDIRPVPALVRGLFGKVYADKGYLSEPLRLSLLEQGIELVTKVRKNMKPRPLSDFDEYLLQKRAFIETVIDQIKNIAQVEHTRHRASTGFVSNVLSALVAYCHQPKKPSLNLQVALPETCP